MRIITLNKGFICLVDDCDFERISNHRWWVKVDKSKTSTIYACSEINQKTVYMHRFILNSSKGQLVDHVNGTHVDNILDNQRRNLRHASHSLNNRNRISGSTNRPTLSGGLIGVTFDKKGVRWMARARVPGRQITIGSFKDKYSAFNALEEWKLRTGYRAGETINL